MQLLLHQIQEAFVLFVLRSSVVLIDNVEQELLHNNESGRKHSNSWSRLPLCIYQFFLTLQLHAGQVEQTAVMLGVCLCLLT